MNSPPHPPLCFAKRGCKAKNAKKFPLFTKYRGGIQGGEYIYLKSILHQRLGILNIYKIP
jgi:hypothetical protein